MTGGITWGVVGFVLLLAVVGSACSAQDSTTYVNEQCGFSIDLDPRFREVHAGQPARSAGSGALDRPDFAVVFADTAGPRIHGLAANTVDVGVIDLGAPVPADDPRLDNLQELLGATLASRGDTGVWRMHEVHMEDAVACAAEYTDPRGRHGLTCMAVAGRHLYVLDALATRETRHEVWPLLMEAVASFRVWTDTVRSSGPRTYVDGERSFKIACDRRFMRLTIARGCWAADALLLLADPLSGVAANGRFNDGLVVYAVALPVCMTAAQRRRIAADVRSGLGRCGMKPICPTRHMRIDGLPACRFESRCADGSRDLLCLVFSGDHAYFIEGCAQRSSWATVKPLLEAAMRSFEARARRTETAIERALVLQAAASRAQHRTDPVAAPRPRLDEQVAAGDDEREITLAAALTACTQEPAPEPWIEPAMQTH